LTASRCDGEIRYPKLAVDTAWAACNNEGCTVNVVIDVGVAITFPPGAKLVLVPPKEEEGPR
jgi:hypothetical protein